MVRKLFWFLILIPAAILLVALSVANRSPVPLTFDPFTPGNPYLTINAPLFAFLFAALAIGLVFGSFITWFAQSRHRTRASKAEAEVAKLRADLKKRDEQMRSLPVIAPAA